MTTAFRRAFAVAVVMLLAGLSPFAWAQPAATLPDRTITHLEREYSADQSDYRAAWYLPASEAYLDRRDTLDRRYLDELADLDFDALDLPARVEYHIFATQIRRSMTDTRRQRDELAEIGPLIPFRTIIHELEHHRRQAAPLDGRWAAEQVARLVDEVKQLHERVERGRKAADKNNEGDDSDEKPSDGDAPLIVTPLVAKTAADAIEQLKSALKHWRSFYDGSQPDFAWWMDKPLEQANSRLDDYIKLLRESIAGLKGKDDDPLLGRPLGSAELAEELRGEWIAYSAEELIAIGERELAWCEAEMRRAAADMGLGDDWKRALAKVKSQFVPPGEQADLVATIGREATEFVRPLVTIPPLCEEAWQIRMMSPEEMKTIPYAAYGGSHAMVAYAAGPMSLEDKLMVMRGNNRHFTRLVVPHELIPGHHLERYYSRRLDNRVRMWTPFFIEGWALYWEMRLWDLGWAHSPEDRIGMLFWRMHRAARVIVSLKYHLNQMTPQEMIEFLVDRVGHERFGATSEVRRYLQYPALYQAAYLIGGLQIYALQREAVEGRDMSDREFHDSVLKIGSMPIELVRVRLLELPIARDSQPSWQFDAVAN